METWVRERCRPGSVQDFYGGVGMFIRHVRSVSMSCFCIFFGEKSRFIFKRPRFVDGHFGAVTLMNYKEKGQNRMLRFALFDIVVRADLLNQTVTFKYFVDCFQCVVKLFDRVSRHQ